MRSVKRFFQNHYTLAFLLLWTVLLLTLVCPVWVLYLRAFCGDVQNYFALKHLDAASAAVTENAAYCGYWSEREEFAIKLSPEETGAVERMLSEFDSLHLTGKPQDYGAVRHTRLCLQNVFSGSNLVLYEDRLRMGDHLFATSDDYAVIYQKIFAYCQSLDPETHQADRPVPG
jgi:hypothetical protein